MCQSTGRNLISIGFDVVNLALQIEIFLVGTMAFRLLGDTKKPPAVHNFCRRFKIRFSKL
jgi:hypothetical protein